jgi:isocitrate dehydrogenase
MLSRIEARYPWCHIELLQHFDGQPGYTKAQGEG